MKQKLLIGAAASLFAVTVSAYDFSNVVHFAQAASEAKSLTLIAAPLYAPEIKTPDGKNDNWGGTVAALYPVLDTGVLRSMAGLRLDYLASQFYTPSVDLQLQTKLTLFNKLDVTPFAVAGAIFPFGQGNDNGDAVGAIVGGGIAIDLVKWSNGKLAVGGDAEKWTPFKGMVYHVGASVSFSF